MSVWFSLLRLFVAHVDTREMWSNNNRGILIAIVCKFMCVYFASGFDRFWLLLSIVSFLRSARTGKNKRNEKKKEDKRKVVKPYEQMFLIYSKKKKNHHRRTSQ